MMKQILVQLDPGLYAALQKLVPASTRKRSEFIRNAISAALMGLQEERTRRAYLKDAQEPGFPFDREAWAPEAEAIHPEGSKPARRRPRQTPTRPSRRAPIRKQARKR